MDEDVINPGFEYWSFDHDYVEEDWRSLASWKYEGENMFEDELRVRVSADLNGFNVIPPYQFRASEPRTYDDPDTAYEEAVRYVEEFDVPDLGESSLDEEDRGGCFG